MAIQTSPHHNVSHKHSQAVWQVLQNDSLKKFNPVQPRLDKIVRQQFKLRAFHLKYQTIVKHLRWRLGAGWLVKLVNRQSALTYTWKRYRTRLILSLLNNQHKALPCRNFSSAWDKRLKKTFINTTLLMLLYNAKAILVVWLVSITLMFSCSVQPRENNQIRHQHLLICPGTSVDLSPATLDATKWSDFTTCSLWQRAFVAPSESAPFTFCLCVISDWKCWSEQFVSAFILSVIISQTAGCPHDHQVALHDLSPTSPPNSRLSRSQISDQIPSGLS